MSELAEFDIDYLHALVDQAIADQPKAENNRIKIPLSFSLGDTSLFELFSEQLQSLLTVDQLHDVLEEVRSQYILGSHSTDLQTLYTFVKNCRKCQEVDPHPKLTVGNIQNPDIVFVYDRPMFATESFKNWIELLLNIGFKKENTAHTSIVRCMPVTGNSINDQCISQCSKSYIFTEIQLLSPKLIVLCGLIPTKTFLGEVESLGSHKGNIHWLGPWALMPVPTMVYSEKSGANALKNLQSDMQLAYNFCYSS